MRHNVRTFTGRFLVFACVSFSTLDTVSAARASAAFFFLTSGITVNTAKAALTIGAVCASATVTLVLSLHTFIQVYTVVAFVLVATGTLQAVKLQSLLSLSHL